VEEPIKEPVTEAMITPVFTHEILELSNESEEQLSFEPHVIKSDGSRKLSFYDPSPI
jgi:hypothetical protein